MLLPLWLLAARILSFLHASLVAVISWGSHVVQFSSSLTYLSFTRLLHAHEPNIRLPIGEYRSARSHASEDLATTAAVQISLLSKFTLLELISGVSANVHHCKVFRLHVVPDSQASFTLLKSVYYGFYCQIFLAHVRDASMRVSCISTSYSIAFFFTIFPLSINNDVDAVLDIFSVSIFVRFHKSELDVGII